MKHVLAILFASLLAGSAFAAPEKKEPYPAPDEMAKPEKPKRVLTPEEKAEKAQRRVCKIEICSVFSSQDPQGADISCPIVKTWREEDIEDILGNHFDWRWGKARCSTQLNLPRKDLAAAAGDGEITVRMDTHAIHCSLDLKSGGETYDVKVEIAPEVKFRDGQAISAKMHWGKLEAPGLAYALIYPGTGLDNSVNALGGEIVKMANEFMGKKCDEVKELLPKRANFSPIPR